MKIDRLHQNLAITSQISLDDIQEIHDLGFSQIVINRPDEEVGDHPRYGTVRQVAESAGIKVAYLPIEPGAATQAVADDFWRLIEADDGPTLAYCKSGMRSRALYKMCPDGDNARSLVARFRNFLGLA